MSVVFAPYSSLYSKKQSLEYYLMACLLFFLPFSQALTIPLFFPLKISELALILYITLKLIKAKPIKFPVSSTFLLLYSLVVLVFISLLINTFTTYNYKLSLNWARLSPTGDSLFKFMYLILAILFFVIAYKEIKRNKDLLKFFFLGTTIACIYCWYLFFSGLLHIPVFKLPGMEPMPQWMPLSFATIIRCGTAKEGNFMAFYLFLSAVIAQHFNKKKPMVLYFATILTTFSTVAVVCAIIYFILVAMYNKRISKLKLLLLAAFMFVLIAVASAVSTDFRSLVINKLVGTEETVDNTNDILSRLDRLNTADVGLRIFLDNPFWGVGASNYSLHYDHYNELPRFDQIFKRVPNNIYVELLSESGIFSFIVFCLIFINVFRLMKGDDFIYLKSGIIIALIYFLAFPTYTMLFIWLFMSIALAEKDRNIMLQQQ